MSNGRKVASKKSTLKTKEEVFILARSKESPKVKDNWLNIKATMHTVAAGLSRRQRCSRE